MPLADKLRRLRHERFLSQAELATRAGVFLRTVQRLEAGQGTPYPRTVRRLAEALGVSPHDLADADEVRWGREGNREADAEQQQAAAA